MQEKRTFCPLPWVFQAVRNNGDYRICCQANISPTQGILRHADGRVANAAVDDPSLARNLPLMKAARLSMLGGEWPASCTRCKNEEAAGLRSRRVYENRIWQSEFTFEDAIQKTSPDGDINPETAPVLAYDLRFGNKCNLKCRMCGPTDSDFWYDDHVHLNGPHFHDSHGLVSLQQDKMGQWKPDAGSYDWYEASEAFWTTIEKNLSQLKSLYIVGGEPLLLEKHYRLLEQIVDSGYAPKVQIEYNTNLTLLPDKVLHLWRQFKSVRVGVSLDGVGAVNDYIRFPSKWSVIERNLRRLDEAEGPIEAWLATTVQIYNIFHLPDLIRWRMESGFKRINASRHQPIITGHPAHNPIHLNIKTMPHQLKAKAIQKFDDFKIEFKDNVNQWRHPQASSTVLLERLDQLLDGYSKFMVSEDTSGRYPEFLRYSTQLDQLRRQNLVDVCPDLI